MSAVHAQPNVLWAGWDCPDDVAVCGFLTAFEWLAAMFTREHQEKLSVFFDLPSEWREALESKCDEDKVYKALRVFSESYDRFYADYAAMLSWRDPSEQSGERFHPIMPALEKLEHSLLPILNLLRDAKAPFQKLEDAYRAIKDGRAVKGDDGEVLKLTEND